VSTGVHNRRRSRGGMASRAGGGGCGMATVALFCNGEWVFVLGEEN
jgi:hypothetical protein